MDDIKRQDQIQKIESLIKKQNVSRRDFFGSLGKIAVLSQVVALGAFNFLSSCIAMEDKSDASGKLKGECSTGFVCQDTHSYQCIGDFSCTTLPFDCGPPPKFTCNPANYEFWCEVFRCVYTFTHFGGTGG